MGCRPGPEDDTSLLRRESSVCRSPVKEKGEEKGGEWWSLRTLLRKIPNEQLRVCEQGMQAGAPDQRLGLEGCQQGPVGNKKAGKSGNQEDMERLGCWGFFVYFF